MNAINSPKPKSMNAPNPKIMDSDIFIPLVVVLFMALCGFFVCALDIVAIEKFLAFIFFFKVAKF